MPQERPFFSQSGTKHATSAGASSGESEIGDTLAIDAAISSSSPARIPMASRTARLASSENSYDLTGQGE